MAALLLVAAASVYAGSGRPSGRVRMAAWGAAGVLVARGLLFIPVDVARGFDDIYERLDIAIYSPLCLALGVGAAWALARGGGHPAY